MVIQSCRSHPPSADCIGVRVPCPWSILSPQSVRLVYVSFFYLVPLPLVSVFNLRLSIYSCFHRLCPLVEVPAAEVPPEATLSACCSHAGWRKT